MTNDEIRMTRETRNPKDEGSVGDGAGTISSFVLGHSFGIRHSDFGIVESLLTSAPKTL